MPKLTDESLLSHLQRLEEDSAQFTWGKLASARERSMREYFRMPYGTEQEGWSTIVTSEVQDTVEWILPDLLDVFTSTDQAVSFEPQGPEDVAGAEQATDTCNYVFYKQNNGFLVLYTAFKDALLAKNCAVHWRKEECSYPETRTLKGVTELHLEEAMTQGWEIEESGPSQEVTDPYGNTFDLYEFVRLKRVTKRKIVKIDAFPPEELLIKRDWTSPLLHDCPYVSRVMRVTLSDVREMGFKDVTAEDLAESDDMAVAPDKSFRESRMGNADEAYADDPGIQADDKSLTEGFLRVEYVLMDVDGDGIAERRRILRLKTRILENEEADHVPFATASPVLVAHRWDGLSVADLVSDLQQLKTELTRQVLNSAYLANNPRSKVLTDAQWTPRANIDDLLDSRPGGVIRQTQPDAVMQDVVPFVGGQMFPLLEYVDGMRQQRTGVSLQQQGMDANALRPDKSATEARLTAAAAKTRIKLMARIFAELLVKPIMQGVLKLLTEGDMQAVAYRLRNEFVQYDPNEWRDQYDMSINVGLGTGDRDQQAAMLQSILGAQMNMAATPYGSALVDPTKVHTTVTKMVENAGFKNVGDFWKDPKNTPPQPPAPPPPDPRIVTKQMELQAEAQRFQAETMRDRERAATEAQAQVITDRNRQEVEAMQKDREQEMQARIDQLNAQRDFEREEREREFEGWKVEFEAQTQKEIAAMRQAPAEGQEGEDEEKAAMRATVQQFTAPRQIVREGGRVTGVQVGDIFRAVVRDQNGQVIGLQ